MGEAGLVKDAAHLSRLEDATKQPCQQLARDPVFVWHAGRLSGCHYSLCSLPS